MKTMITTLAAVGLINWASMSVASDDEHFSGLKPTTYTQAQAYLKKYNAKLAALVADDKITPTEMAEVHQLTYTLENSLQRMRDSIEQIEEVLELVHKDSEHGRYERGLLNTQQYLQDSKILLQEK